MKTIFYLVKKDFLLESRQKYALGGLLLYVLSTVFVIFLVLQYGHVTELSPDMWNALFWMTILFVSINAIAKSFVQESKERMLYYYTLVTPQAIILSKLVYNAMLMLLLALLAIVVFSVVLGNPVNNHLLFAGVLILGGTGFSFVLSMVAAIASKAGNNTTLMAILSFPLILPMLLIIIKLAAASFVTAENLEEVVLKNTVALLAFDVALVALSYVLYPYLWRD